MVLIESVNEKYFLIAFQNELYIYDLRFGGYGQERALVKIRINWVYLS